MIIKFTSAQNYQITNIDGGKAEKQIAMSRSMTRQSHQLLSKFIQPKTRDPCTAAANGSLLVLNVSSWFEFFWHAVCNLVLARSGYIF